MTIEIQFSEEVIKKLAYIQQETQQDLTEVIQSSINFYYQQIQKNTDPLAQLKQSPFIGCFQAEPDFSANSEVILRSSIKEKYDHC